MHLFIIIIGYPLAGYGYINFVIYRVLIFIYFYIVPAEVECYPDNIITVMVGYL